MHCHTEPALVRGWVAVKLGRSCRVKTSIFNKHTKKIPHRIRPVFGAELVGICAVDASGDGLAVLCAVHLRVDSCIPA